MILYLSNLNILHHENCLYCNSKILMKFNKLKEQNEIDFLVSTIIYLVNLKKEIVVEICPHCLGKKFNFLSSEFNLFKT
ncbi:MAG: hypothetical protein ACRC3I_00470 [Cetobacterium sp.]